MKKKIIKNTKIQYQIERRFLYAVSSLLLCSFVLYIYFVSAAVVHVVMRKDVDKEISSLSSVLSSLESKYIEAQHTMSEDIATHKGFSKAESKVFIDMSKTTLVLNNN